MTPAKLPGNTDGGARSQTLDRGIQALIALAEADEAMTIQELSDSLGLHRSIVYRILRTFEDHALVWRDQAGRLQLGPRLAILARSVSRDLQSIALPVMTELANEVKMTAFIAVWDDRQCVTLVAVEPRRAPGAVVQRAGTLHSFTSGAPGIAIQSALSEAEWDASGMNLPYREEARVAAAVGYAVSHDEVISGASAVATPLLVPEMRPAALAVVYETAEVDVAALGAAVQAAAAAIQRDFV